MYELNVVTLKIETLLIFSLTYNSIRWYYLMEFLLGTVILKTKSMQVLPSMQKVNERILHFSVSINEPNKIGFTVKSVHARIQKVSSGGPGGASLTTVFNH